MDVTKEEVIAIYDKWEEEVRVIVQVISFVRTKQPFLDLILLALSIWRSLLDGLYVQ